MLLNNACTRYCLKHIGNRMNNVYEITKNYLNIYYFRFTINSLLVIYFFSNYMLMQNRQKYSLNRFWGHSYNFCWMNLQNYIRLILKYHLLWIKNPRFNFKTVLWGGFLIFLPKYFCFSWVFLALYFIK